MGLNSFARIFAEISREMFGLDIARDFHVEARGVRVVLSEGCGYAISGLF
jgi:hypothetical protein